MNGPGIVKARKVAFPLFPIDPNPEIPLTSIQDRRFDLFERAQYLVGEGMFDHHDNRTVTVIIEDVLKTLRANLAEHSEIVEEARDGYIDKCKAALGKAEEEIAKRRAKLAEGEAITMRPISFDLQPPEDHSKEFVTAIKMLELHKAAYESDPSNNGRGPATYQFKAVDVQRLVLNDWSWMDSFLANTSAYSPKAAVLFASRS